MPKQMSGARLLTLRDLAGLDFTCSPVDHKLVLQLAK